MNPNAINSDITQLLSTLSSIGTPIEIFLPVMAAVLLVLAVVPGLRRYLRPALAVTSLVLLVGQVLLGWFHWQLYDLAVVVSPQTGQVVGQVAVPLWVESGKLYFWALLLAVLGYFIQRHREELLPGVSASLAFLMLGAAFWGKPFTDPLPSFLARYTSYLAGMASGDPAQMMGAFQSMEGSRQFFYNTFWMWVHPPALFFAYATFAIAFVATLLMVWRRRSSFETTAYRWIRLGYAPFTAGMLLGFPWAILAWPGESWWWSGKVNLSIMMWVLYTAVLHAHIYVRRPGMWKWIAALSILSFVVLVLTYLSTYVIPGAHAVV